MVEEVIVGGIIVLEVNEGLTESGGECNVFLAFNIKLTANSANELEELNDVVGRACIGVLGHPVKLRFEGGGTLAVDKSPCVDEVGFVDSVGGGVSSVVRFVVDLQDVVCVGISEVTGGCGGSDNSGRGGQSTDGNNNIPRILVGRLDVVFDGFEGAPKLVCVRGGSDIEDVVLQYAIGVVVVVRSVSVVRAAVIGSAGVIRVR